MLFRGGLELRSRDPDFGGISSLLVSRDGSRFLAVTDEAHWILGRLDYRDGQLVDATGETIAPMLDADGRPMEGKLGDAEGLASASPDGRFDDLFVSFEGTHRVWRYPFGAAGVKARPEPVPLPAAALRTSPNGGIEGLVLVRDSTLLAVTERDRNRDGNYRAWLVPFANGSSDVSRAPAWLSIKPVPPFSMTDVRMLETGELLTLERRFDRRRGVGMQMRRITWTPPEDGQRLNEPLDGEVVVNLDAGYEIDNMEGIDLRRGDDGEQLVYVISDDNFNRPLQRTLLLMFELLP
jgi:hypothetical protein